jgi:cytochrome c-type biogenesis protein
MNSTSLIRRGAAVSAMAIPPGAVLLLDLAGISFAFTVGVSTFFSPCSYSLLPVYMLYYLGRSSSRQDAAQKGLVSAFGILSVFVILGLIAAYLGLLFNSINLAQYSGLMLVAMGLITLSDLHLPVHFLNLSPPRRTDLLGLYLFGAAYGLASVGCSLAMFLSVMAYALTIESFPGGFLLILSYSLGIAIPMVLMSLVGANISRFTSRWNKSAALKPWLHRLGGLALLAIGAYLVFISYLS